MRRSRANHLGVLVVAAVAALAAAPSLSAAAPGLRAGAGEADVTPPQTGYPLGGFVRADRLALGQHTRLLAKALVLERGDRKVALVAVELFMIPSGLHQHVAEALASRGFDVDNLLISATHTHSGPGGYANFPTYNTVAPSSETIDDPSSFVDLLNPEPADRQLYTFLVHQIATAIRRADRDLAPAVAGWGRERLVGLTQNRSVEAHLANHGVIRNFGQGSAAQDPEGEVHTIDPSVDVLRVDKLVGGRRVPVGAWSNFANHGTVVKAEFGVYNGDHHATAHRVFEARVRRAGHVPRNQEVVNVYGNSNEGDMSAGLEHTGPAGAQEVGMAEARAMLRAWERAGRRLRRTPRLGLRWTRVCFCGQAAGHGNVATTGGVGVPFLTGSEENRGPLFDITGIPFEGLRSPVGFDSQGHKLQIPFGEFPKAVPLMLVRIGSGAIASLPGEPTKEVGARAKRAVLRGLRAKGVRRVVIAGLANEYINYLTTPEEYERQHYEGGSTLYGIFASPFLIDGLNELAKRLAAGRRAPSPAPFDGTHGVVPNGPPYPAGADDGTIVDEPRERVRRLGHARIAWQGAPSGHDLPVGRAFVVIQRRVGERWRTVDSDLGLGVLWRVNDSGHYRAYWEVPLAAPIGRYRLLVTAAGYRLSSRPFKVDRAFSLQLEPAAAPPGHYAVRLAYPAAIENVDLRARPRYAQGGVVRFRVGDRLVEVRSRGTTFTVRAPEGAPVEVAEGAARDRHGNRNGTAFSAT